MKHLVTHKTKHGIIVTSNTTAPAGGDRYDFKLQVEPESPEEVERVEYVLHDTFSDPTHERRNPEDKFALQSNGWRELDVGVRIQFKDGTVERLHHPLKLFE